MKIFEHFIFPSLFINKPVFFFAWHGDSGLVDAEKFFLLRNRILLT